MADIVSAEERSRNMAAIRNRDTKPEVYLRKLLFARGYRYRIADKSVPGHPDIFLRKYNTAIFVHGCSGTGIRVANMRTRPNPVLVKCLVIWECTIKRTMKDRQYEAKIIEECKQFLVAETLLQEL